MAIAKILERPWSDHAYTEIASCMNFCGWYDSQYGHCGYTKEEHKQEAAETESKVKL